MTAHSRQQSQSSEANAPRFRSGMTLQTFDRDSSTPTRSSQMKSDHLLSRGQKVGLSTPRGPGKVNVLLLSSLLFSPSLDPSISHNQSSTAEVTISAFDSILTTSINYSQTSIRYSLSLALPPNPLIVIPQNMPRSSPLPKKPRQQAANHPNIPTRHFSVSDSCSLSNTDVQTQEVQVGVR
jgi:hypothetical protein